MYVSIVHGYGMIKKTRGTHGRIIGDRNRADVISYMSGHIGATNDDCARSIGLSSAAVGRHIRTIKAEWQTPKKRNSSKGRK